LHKSEMLGANVEFFRIEESPPKRLGVDVMSTPSMS
jgi:hypothetical protein